MLDMYVRDLVKAATDLLKKLTELVELEIEDRS